MKKKKPKNIAVNVTEETVVSRSTRNSARLHSANVGQGLGGSGLVRGNVIHLSPGSAPHQEPVNGTDRSRFCQKKRPTSSNDEQRTVRSTARRKSCSWLLPAEHATWKRPTGLFRGPKKSYRIPFRTYLSRCSSTASMGARSL